jgi:hypothetical protein
MREKGINHFEGNGSTCSPGYYQLLKAIAQQTQEKPVLKISISGELSLIKFVILMISSHQNRIILFCFKIPGFPVFSKY